VVADPAGAIVVTSGSLRLVDDSGKLDATPRGVARISSLVRATDGSIYAAIPPPSGGSASVHRYTSGLTEDTSFVFDGTKWPATSLVGVAVAPDRSVYLAGTVDQNTSQAHVVVRHFSAAGAYDAAFAPPDDQMPKGLRPSGIALAKDGGILVRADDGFTPAVLRLTPDGAPDAAFGTAGVLLLSSLGPRYSRAMIVDGQDRIVVLGMQNDVVQIARLLPSGAPDDAFGDAGVASVNLDSKPLASSYTESAEARGMAIDAQGRIVVSADYAFKQNGDPKPTEETLRLVRFDAAGKLDTSFGDQGIAKIDFGGGATSSKNAYTGAVAPLGDGRLLVGGQKMVGTTASNVLACVKM